MEGGYLVASRRLIIYLSAPAHRRNLIGRLILPISL
jgi:hypothetical protein